MKRTTVQSNEEIRKIDIDLHNALKDLELLKDPEDHIPPATRFKFLKKSILRILKVYTDIQIQFNIHILHSLALFYKFIHIIFDKFESLEIAVDDIKDTWEKDRVALLRTYLKDIDPLLQDKFADLKKSLAQQEVPSQKSLYFSQFEDDYYVFQQEKFRGSYEMIQERQQKYIPQIRRVQPLSRKYSFVDVGFGRGEFIEILREQNIKKIIGVDTNSVYVKKAKEKGYEAVCQDGIQFLQEYDGILSGISAFHVVEHITFPQLFDFVYLAYMKLARGGLVLFETPNVENVLVSSHSFYIDHTHILKLPPVFLKSVFEYFKFSHIEIVYNLPIKEERNSDTERVLFGPQDYAIVAYK